MRKRVLAIVLSFGMTVGIIYPMITSGTNTVIAAESYILTAPLKKYVTADNAKKGVNSVGIYNPGNYYVYKRYNGMINITKLPGTAGAWINPNDNGVTSEEVTTSTSTTGNTNSVTTSTTKPLTTAPATNNGTNNLIPGNSYTLYKDIPTFITANDARLNTNRVGSYRAGSYYIYKIHNGMLNISKVKGQAGAWINPSKNTSNSNIPTTTTTSSTTTSPTTTSPTTTSPVTNNSLVIEVGGKYTLTKATFKYMNAIDAKNGTNNIGSYGIGTYYVFRIYGGMINITKTPGVPGAWINPGSSIVVNEGSQVNKEWNTILVNPWNKLPANFKVNLSYVEGGYRVDSRIYNDFVAMMAALRNSGKAPVLISSYRSYDLQTYLYNNEVQNFLNQGYSYETAKRLAAQYTAIPGTSEHHTGLAVDIVDANYQSLNENQAFTAVQKWLFKNAPNYGFILRYPKNKTNITGIAYEPWHYRYVGKGAAREITERGITLEEYLR